MMRFAVQIELANMVAVQRPHDADAREHRRAAVCRHQDQGFHCSLPLGSRMLSLRKLRDVVAGVLERDELTAAGQRYSFIGKKLELNTKSHFATARRKDAVFWLPFV
jgi:hypothetical protein